MYSPLVVASATSAGNTLVVLISFIILFLLLKKFAWKPVTEIMEKRSQTIAGDLDNAKKASEEAERLKAEQENQLTSIQLESARLIEQARSNAAKIEEDLTNETKQSITQMKVRAKEDIELERQRVLEETKKDVSLLSFEIAEKLIEKELNQKTHTELIDRFIERLSDSNEIK